MQDYYELQYSELLRTWRSSLIRYYDLYSSQREGEVNTEVTSTAMVRSEQLS